MGWLWFDFNFTQDIYHILSLIQRIQPNEASVCLSLLFNACGREHKDNLVGFGTR